MAFGMIRTSTTPFSQGLSCDGNNPQDHSHSPLRQQAALDPKQHSSNTSWGWRGHLLGQSIHSLPCLPAEQPVQPHRPRKPAQAQFGSYSTSKGLSSTDLSQGVSLPPWLTTFLPNKCKTMKSTFPSWQRWDLFTFQSFIVFWFGDNLCNKSDDVFSSRSLSSWKYKGNCVSNPWMTTKIVLSQKKICYAHTVH